VANQFIEKLKLYSALDDGAVAALTQATANTRWVASRHDLIREGDRPGPVFVILEGWACRYKILPSGTRQVLAHLMPGDSCDLHIGLLAFMDHSIQTLTDVRVATIERADMDELLERHRGIAKAMYIGQLIDEGTMRAWITSMGRRTSIERVAHLMCELYLRARNVGLTQESTLEVPLSQTLLADSLGMTAVHINRVLKRFRLDEIMTFKRGGFTINDPSKLAQIAGFDENYLHRRLRQAA
jgi:CRP-like cAMP-binding protein